jgi:hypothetical protein
VFKLWQKEGKSFIDIVVNNSLFPIHSLSLAAGKDSFRRVPV